MKNKLYGCTNAPLVQDQKVITTLPCKLVLTLCYWYPPLCRIKFTLTNLEHNDNVDSKKPKRT